MRARLAIIYAGIQVELREILLKNKPAEMLEASAKGTVPVLVLESGEVIDESLAVMFWALLQSDNHELDLSFASQRFQHQLIAKNDHDFKHWLDRYKYHVGYPEQPQEYYRKRAEEFLGNLESLLDGKGNLFGNQTSLADIAIFPFVRQFAFVDKPWFDQCPYTNLKNWLDRWLDTDEFHLAMQKFPEWISRKEALQFPG